MVGYYTLRAPSFRREALPADQAKRLPYYPAPGALLGRLAVDLSQQGFGLGAYLLIDETERVHSVTRVVAVQALVVEPGTIPRPHSTENSDSASSSTTDVDYFFRWQRSGVSSLGRMEAVSPALDTEVLCSSCPPHHR